MIVVTTSRRASVHALDTLPTFSAGHRKNPKGERIGVIGIGPIGHPSRVELTGNREDLAALIRAAHKALAALEEVT